MRIVFILENLLLREFHLVVVVVFLLSRFKEVILNLGCVLKSLGEFCEILMAGSHFQKL